MQKSNDVIVSQPAQAAHYVEESQQDYSADSDEENALLAENSHKPSLHEIKEICTELKRLRINPEPCLGVVKKHWGNVQGAIARVKEAVQEGWCNNPTGLFINSCKSGAKGKNAVTSDISAWFKWAYSKRIVGAMSGGVAYTLDGEPVDLLQMMRLYPCPE